MSARAVAVSARKTLPVAASMASGLFMLGAAIAMLWVL